MIRSAKSDQLIFGQSLSNKLFVLSEDNIIENVTRTKQLGGIGMRIVYQPTEQAGMVEPPELVLAKCTSLEMPITERCTIRLTL